MGSRKMGVQAIQDWLKEESQFKVFPRMNVYHVD